MQLEKDDRNPSEILMESLAEVEGAEHVAILLVKDGGIHVKSNMEHKELHWLLTLTTTATTLDAFDLLHRPKGE